MSRVRAAALAGVAVLLGAACGPAPSAAPGRSGMPAPRFAPGPWTSSLTAACVPSGPELCFNAIDDNCNGIIDEGCGVCTGPLQFTIAWADAAVDVDLVVVDPTGAKIDAPNQSTPSGLRLDRDCPKDGCGGQNVENVCSQAPDPPRGRYVMEVRLSPKTGAVTPAVKVRVGVRVGDRSYGADLELSPFKDVESVSFVL